RPGQPGDRVEDDDDVLPLLDLASRALERELGEGDVLLGRAVEARRDDLAEAARLHLRDLLGPLVDQENQELALRMVPGDPLGDGLQDRRLPRLRRRDDQRALALAERAEEVDDPRRVVRLAPPHGLVLEREPVARVHGAQPAESRTAARLRGRVAVDREQTHQGRALPTTRRLAELAVDLVAGA